MERVCGNPPAAMATSGRGAFLQQVYHHVVLPRDVPGREESNLHQIELQLATRLVEAVEHVISHAPSNDHACVDAVRLALSTCASLHIDGKVDKPTLLRELQQLEDRRALVLHVAEQNAGLLIYPQLRSAILLQYTTG